MTAEGNVVIGESRPQPPGDEALLWGMNTSLGSEGVCACVRGEERGDVLGVGKKRGYGWTCVSGKGRTEGVSEKRKEGV